jgi:hypothetical protein
VTPYDFGIDQGPVIPKEVMLEARMQAAQARREGKIRFRAGVAIVLGVWAIGFAFLAFLVYRYVAR